MLRYKKILLFIGFCLLCLVIPPVIGFCEEIVQPGGMLTIPDALGLLGILATIIVAMIRYIPSKNLAKQPINITVTWPDKIPTHDHPECVKAEYCALARDGFQRELNDLKRKQS